jgi:hypothetical protein
MLPTAPFHHAAWDIHAEIEVWHKKLNQKSKAAVKSHCHDAALLNLKEYCVGVRALEIRILARSIEKQFVLDAFMEI